MQDRHWTKRRGYSKRLGRAINLARPVGIKATRPMCAHTGKVRFSTRRSAAVALRELRSGQRRAYQCISCMGWHLTSQELARETDRRAEAA